MDNRYNYFADEEMNKAVRSVDEAKDAARMALLTWRESMETQLVADILETMEDMLNDNTLPEEEFVWRSVMVVKSLVSQFASGILYAQEKLG